MITLNNIIAVQSMPLIGNALKHLFNDTYNKEQLDFLIKNMMLHSLEHGLDEERIINDLHMCTSVKIKHMAGNDNDHHITLALEIRGHDGTPGGDTGKHLIDIEMVFEKSALIMICMAYVHQDINLSIMKERK
jgi:hypothetical protein